MKGKLKLYNFQLLKSKLRVLLRKYWEHGINNTYWYLIKDKCEKDIDDFFD